MKSGMQSHNRETALHHPAGVQLSQENEHLAKCVCSRRGVVILSKRKGGGRAFHLLDRGSMHGPWGASVRSPHNAAAARKQYTPLHNTQ